MTTQTAAEKQRKEDEKLTRELDQQQHARMTMMEAHRRRERDEALYAQSPHLRVEEDYESPEVLAASRNPAGFRKSGIFVGPTKTIIPAGSFKNSEAFDAFMNEQNIIAIESPSKKLREGASTAAASFAAPVIRNSSHAGIGENATPQMLQKAEEGVLEGHPSLAVTTQAPVSHLNRVPPADSRELEKEALARGVKKGEKGGAKLGETKVEPGSEPKGNADVGPNSVGAGAPAGTEVK